MSEDDLVVVICGEAGQGLQSALRALTVILKQAQYNAFANQEYMSRVRGGCNSAFLRIASQKKLAFVKRIDVLIPTSKDSAEHLKDRISDQTLIISVDKIDFIAIANTVGNKIYTSSVCVGFILGIFQIEAKLYQDYFRQIFQGNDDLIAKNILAAELGYQACMAINSLPGLKHNIQKNPELDQEILLSGSRAIALGALAGGCNFISAYPMSPSTGVLNQLAAASHDFDIIVEQAEDEIAAINMALGAWYAGAKALVATSGGGFALMCEGISLAGMTETPIVINLAQRPGPATGLPTRTEQGDLNLALYAGHGEFPRIIFAPGTLLEGFNLMQRAFYLADKYQIPVILLSDQYLVDSEYAIKPPDPALFNPEQQSFITQTKPDYKRYQLTPGGISPRGIPSFGEGIVAVDSDEHTEAGYITEDFSVRAQMVDKRLKKLISLQNEAVAPTFTGADNYKILVISWGSNYHAAQEALSIINNPDLASLHFSQVYPLPVNIYDFLKKAQIIISIENNATGQFTNLLQQEFQVTIDKRILKYDGMPFAASELVDAIRGKL